MKNKMKSLLSYSTFRKTLYAYTAGIVGMILMILILLSTVIMSQFKNMTLDNSRLMLDQLVSSSNYIRSDVNNILTLIANDTDTVHFVRQKEESKLLNYRLHTKLLNLKSPYSYVVDMSVVNYDNKISVQTTGTNINNGVNYTLAVSARDAGKTIIPREITLHSTTKSYYVISFLYYLPNENSVVILDIEADRFKRQINQSDSTFRDIYIIDTEGNPITRNAYSLTEGTNMPYYRYFSTVLETMDDKTASFLWDDTKNKQMILFSKSENNDWWFVDVQRTSSFYDAYTHITMILIAIAVLCVAISIIISILFSKKIRKPLVQLVDKWKADYEMDTKITDEYQYLDDALVRIERERLLNEKHIKALYLKSVILEQDIPFFLSGEHLEKLKKRYTAPWYTVFVVRIRPLGQAEECPGREEQSAVRHTVCKLCEEIFGQRYDCAAVSLGGDLVAVLLMLGGQTAAHDLSLLFGQIRDFAEEQLQITLTGSIGSTVEQFDEVPLSYLKAKQYLDMGSITGKTGLIDSQDLSNIGYHEKNIRLVDSVMEYARQHYGNPDLSLKYISQLFGLSTTYLGKIFKSIHGSSFSSFLTAYRLEQAKSALLNTKKTVNEISAEVGFANSTYFTTVFRGRYGMTPTAFRNQKNQ